MSASSRRALVDMAERFIGERGNEATLQARLHGLLSALWGEDAIAMEYGLLDGGKIDLVSRASQVAFELKAPGSLKDENSTGFKDAVSQLRGYLQELAKLEPLSWEGVLTDGSWWYSCHIVADELRVRTAVKLAGAVHLLNEIGDLGVVDIRHPPYEVWQRFSYFDLELTTDIWPASQGETTESQFNLWSDILRGSGMDERDPEIKRQLFRKHTFLACFARLVRAQLTNDARELPHLLGEGYWSWVIGTQRGRVWADRLRREINRFDWKLGETDVLRKLYEDAINKRQRYTFGEYYTPDWVAQAVVEEVLDDTWIRESVPKALQGRAEGIGVLDPACGSGTFLYHAAKRIAGHPCLTPYKPTRRAKVVASLVYGIDIHPVAVEIAHVTLLRALPADPDVRLHIYQGDSLQLKNFGPVSPSRGILTPLYRWEIEKGKTNIELPAEFVKSEDFPEHLEEFFRTAREGETPPQWQQYSTETLEILATEHERSVALIREHGNSVWSWYVLNTVYPKLLAERKADRIIANPPWVTINSIQDPDRDQAVKEEAKELELWQGGKLATKFDIASVFVLKCEKLYLSGTEPCKTGWVLNYASINASTWEPFRNQLHGPHHFWDLSEIKPPPFHGAKSAIWFRGFPEHQNHKIIPKNPQQTRWSRYQWKKQDWQYLETATPLPDYNPEDIPYPTYLDNKHKARFRNGATLFPICLVRVETHKNQGDGQIWVKTKSCRHNPWRDQVGQIEGLIPAQWLQQILLTNDMLPYCARKQPSYAIIPANNNQHLLTGPTDNQFWQTAEHEWKLHKGKGPTTPATLINNINYHNKLRSQLEVTGPRIAYNNSGTHLRAIVVTDTRIIIENAIYYLEVETLPEAHYLTGILNSGILQPLYRRSRKTDRHFAAHIWYKIPIPAFQPNDPLHQTISQTALEAQHLAEENRNTHDPNGEKSQPNLSKQIRHNLQEAGITDKLDSSVAELLEQMRKHSLSLR